MTQQSLHRSNIHPGFQQIGSKLMSQGVSMHLGETGFLGKLLNFHADPGSP